MECILLYLSFPRSPYGVNRFVTPPHPGAYPSGVRFGEKGDEEGTNPAGKPTLRAEVASSRRLRDLSQQAIERSRAMIAQTRMLHRQAQEAIQKSEALVLDHLRLVWDRNLPRVIEEMAEGDIYRNRFIGKAFMDFIGPVSRQRVLDAGCGVGWWINEYLRAGGVDPWKRPKMLAGIDFSADTVRYAVESTSRLLSEIPEKQRPQVYYRTGSFLDRKDMETALYGGQDPGLSASARFRRFDTIISAMALMDAPKLQEAVRLFFRALQSGGKFNMLIKHPFTTQRNADFLETIPKACGCSFPEVIS